MPYLNETGLAHYDPKLKEWIASQPVKTLPSSLYPWTLTDKAGAVTCWPVGGTELKPTVDFLFTEVPPASGDKGPENPSTISGVSSVNVTRTGKNLLTKIPMASTMPQRGITVTYNADGSIHLSGTASSSSLPYLRFFTVEPGIVPSILTAGTTLTVSLTCSDSRVYCALYDSDSPMLWGDATIIYPGTPVTHTMSANVKTANLSMVVTRGAVIDCDVYCQIEFGQSATAWEAPADEDYPLPLGGTYYGGTLDVASGVMTVTWEGIVLTGSEPVTTDVVHSGTYYHYSVPAPSRASAIMNNSTRISSHYTFVNNVDQNVLHFALTQTTIHFFVTQTTASALKTWWASEYEAGHPVVICYLLETPFTVQLTPTQILSLVQADKYTPRLNTVYTDAQAVQVGYVKSPIREEFELQQAIVGQGGNI